MGVTPFYKHYKHDGVQGPNMATVYSDRGYGMRAPVVFYNRCNEAAAQLKPGDFNWKELFASGVRWFHSGGIFAALSPTTAELIIEGMRAAKAAGAVTSFDLNYRAKLWNFSGGPERAVSTLDRIVQNVDVLVGNEEDLQMGLGFPGPKVAAKSKLDPSAFVGMIDKVTGKYAQVKIIATTLREVHSTNRHTWGAVAWINGKTFTAPTCELDVYDRVGGGDRGRLPRIGHRSGPPQVRAAVTSTSTGTGMTSGAIPSSMACLSHAAVAFDPSASHSTTISS